MKGSYSIKYVLPALVSELSYDELLKGDVIKNNKLIGFIYGEFDMDLHIHKFILNLNIDLTLSDISKLPNNLDGVLWISGFTGNPEEEMNNTDKARYNIEVNFTTVLLSITSLLEKINYSKETFICVICSVAGIRGRKKR